MSMCTQINSSDELRCIYLGYSIYPIKRGHDVIVDHNLNLGPLLTEQPTREIKDEKRGGPSAGK